MTNESIDLTYVPVPAGLFSAIARCLKLTFLPVEYGASGWGGSSLC